MTTLTDFLLARLDERKELARWALDQSEAMVAAGRFPNARGARMTLAECEAKRRIVEGLQPYGELDDLFAPEILGILALPYADHPDYREEWKP